MDNPEDKLPNQIPPRRGVPRPPVPGKGPGNIPKGPVPPRGQAGIPRIPSPPGGVRPGNAANPPSGLPASGRPPFKPGAGAPANFQPPKPPMPGMSPMPPATQKMSDQLNAAAGQSLNLEDKISQLEKKLAEEKEKVLLASLRTKDEEAISIKVENSIKEIQDKLRREKREQELDESRKKAEQQVSDVERRLAEEREAWVATLKNQLNQRDQISQEMEGHFSTRLKDLEYRWAQEKSSLETSIREKEGEILRIQNENKLKSEQEKAFWEDRIRVISTDREKVERELERARDKAQQERETFQMERQALRDSASRYEASLKILEEKSGVENVNTRRELEGMNRLIKEQADLEKGILNKEISQLERQIQAFEKESIEKGAKIDSLKAQMSSLQFQLDKSQSLFVEVDRSSGNFRGQLLQANEELKNLKEELSSAKVLVGKREIEIQELNSHLKESEKVGAKYKSQIEQVENQIIELRRDLRKAELANGTLDSITQQKNKLETQLIDRESKLSDLKQKYERENLTYQNEISKLEQQHKKEIQDKEIQMDTRVRTLQARLDHYDVNAAREYSVEKEKVKEEVSRIQAQLAQSQFEISELSKKDKNIEEISKERDELKQAHWDAENKIKSSSEALNILQNKFSFLENEKEKIAVHEAELSRERDELKSDLENIKSELKQVHWDAENRIKSSDEALLSFQNKFSHIENENEKFANELRDRQSETVEVRSLLNRKQEELDRLGNKAEVLRQDYDLAKDKIAHMAAQIEEYKKIMTGKSVVGAEELKEDILLKERELEHNRKIIAVLNKRLEEADVSTEVVREKENTLRQSLEDKNNLVNDFRSRVKDLEGKMNQIIDARDRVKEELEEKMNAMKAENIRATLNQLNEQKNTIDRNYEEQIAKLKQQFAKEIEEAKEMAAKAAEERIRTELPANGGGQDAEALRNQIEQEMMDQMRQREDVFEEKTKELQKAAKKEADHLRWENESMKEENKKIRESRNSIEKEAQDLLQKAEAHYNRELKKQKSELIKTENKNKGIFTRIGKILDHPIIDTNKKKDEEAEL